MSSKGIPESGTLRLSDLKKAWRAGSVIQTNTWTTPANGSMTAPAAATWVKIELYGGGGGGRGYGGTEYGGGGGGYTKYEMPVEGGVTSIGYRCGAGGAGGTSGNDGGNGWYSHANNIPVGVLGTGTSTIYAYGGSGGDDGVGGNGGSTEFDISDGTYDIKKRGTGEKGEAGGVGTYYHGGDAAGPSGGAGATSSGANGTAPGGGGAGRYLFTSPYDGGDGATGKVIFTWYNEGSTQRLRDFIAGGSICDYQATGNNQNIPSSGTMRLKHFYSSDELGWVANTEPGNNAFFEADFDSVSTEDAPAVASANLSFNSGTSHMTHSYSWGRAYDRALDSSIDSELMSRFTVQFTPFSGTAPTGSSVNTWIAMNFGPKWYLNVSRSGVGTTTATCNGWLRFRRTLDNVEVVNVKISMSASADVYTDFDTK